MPGVGVAHAAGHRGRGDDTTEAVVDHRWQRGTHDVEDAVEVCLHHVLEHLLGHACHRTRCIDACVGKQNPPCRILPTPVR